MDYMKIRAWHKPSNKMYTRSIESINFETKVLGVYTVGEGYKQLRLSDFEIMQFTGLTDKNGKEIYVGDILSVPVDGNQDIHGSFSLKEVFLKNGAFIVSYLTSEKGKILPKGYTAGFLLDLYDFDNKSFLFNESPSMDTEIEVVGNVFKNPDLFYEVTE